MARRREDKAITKHTLFLYSGDYQSLQSHYGLGVGAAKIIRDLVHLHVKKIRGKAEQVVPRLLAEEIAPELDKVMSGDYDIDLEEST
jgi:hypothetical protein